MEKERIIAYHSLSNQEVLSHLQTSLKGLSFEESEKRFKEFGPNTIEINNIFNYFKAIWEALKNPFSVILIIAAGLSFVSQHSVDGYIIVSVLLINVSIEVFHKKSAHKNIELLKKSVNPTVVVLRGGVEQKINSSLLVPGDIVILEEGSNIPADGRIIEQTNLHCNESALTGESIPVRKESSKIVGISPILELKNMVWLGTEVSEGSGIFVVTATGYKTQFGILNKQLNTTKRDKNPFLERIQKMSKVIGIWGFGIVGLIFLIRFGILEENLMEVILFSLAVLVSIIPESLPTVINISLAQGSRHLAEKNAVVKELSNIESIGSTSILLTDKTGTITENSMKVEHIHTRDGMIFDVTGFGWKSIGIFLHKAHKFTPEENPHLNEMLNYAILSNRSHIYEEDGRDVVIGEPTEAALLVLGQKDGRNRSELLRQYNIVFRTRFINHRKILLTSISQGDLQTIITIGAPESIWEFSDVDEVSQKQTNEWAERGLRTIAFAHKTIPATQIFDDQNFESELHNFSYQGVVAMRDPIRHDVKEMITQARESGVRIIMATGDHSRTAEYIGKELGIITSHFPNIITGAEFEILDEKQQKEVLKTTNIFARVTPQTKLQITKLLQKNKEVVTMVGDGINDTLALKQSDVGVAMGEAGTDAAKNASSIVLTNDSLSTIISAIFQGRHISKNIRSMTNFLLSTNGAEALVLILVSFFGMPLPLLATHILFINLVTDGIGSLPFAFKKPDSTKLPRLHSGKFLSKFDYGIMVSAILGMTIGTLLAFSLYLDKGLSYAQTMAFATLALTELGRLISIQTYHQPFWKFKGYPWLWKCLGISLGLIILVLSVPIFRDIFNFEILEFIDILVAISLSLIPFVFVETYKICIKKLKPLYYHHA